METHYEYTNFSILVPGPSQIVQTREIRFKLSRMYSIPNGFIVSNIARFENLDGLLLEMGGNCFVTERSSLDPIAWQRKRNMISKVGVGFFPTVSTSIGGQVHVCIYVLRRGISVLRWGDIPCRILTIRQTIDFKISSSSPAPGKRCAIIWDLNTGSLGAT